MQNSPIKSYLGIKPLAIYEPYLDSLNMQLQVADASAEKKAFLETDSASKGYQRLGNIAVIPVSGVLEKAPSFIGWLFDFSNYQDIRAMFDAALSNDDVEAIVFNIASGGGMVSGCFDLVDYIYNSRGDKPIYAYCDDAYSAAYAIASAADQVFLSRTSGVGSVGVIALHYEQSKAEEDVGVKYTAIYAGDHKNDWSMHEPLTKEAKSLMKADIDDTYDIFCEAVARNRNIAVQQVKTTQARIYQGQNGVNVGLADDIVNFEALTDKISKDLTNEFIPMSQKTAEKKDEKPAADTQQPASIAKVEKQPEASQPVNDAQAIAKLCKEAGKAALAADYIAEGMSLASAKDALITALSNENSEMNAALSKKSSAVTADIDISENIMPAATKQTSPLDAATDSIVAESKQHKGIR